MANRLFRACLETSGSTLLGYGAAVIFMSLLGLSLPGSAFAEGDDDPVVAIVNGEKIQRSDLELAAGMLPPQYQQMPFEVVFPALLDQVVDGKLIEAAGRKENIQNDELVVSRLKKAEDRIIQQVYLTRYVEPRLTDEALRQHYDALVAASKEKEEVHARHILVDSEEEAREVIAALAGGADFIELAKEKSVAPEGAKGGDLGFFQKEEMVPEFANAAFAMGVDEVSSEPVKTSFGWHVIKVEERREAKLPPFDEVKEELHSSLSQKLLGDLVVGLRKGAEIELFDIDGNPQQKKKTDTPDKPADGAE